MGLRVTFVCGPRRSGKSAIIETLVKSLCSHAPHYLRLTARGGDKKPPSVKRASHAEPCGVASARWLDYQDDQVFTILPDTLTQIHQMDRYGVVFIEGDSDPHLRHVYPYDHRIFIMPRPRNLHQVFRTSEEAAGAFREVLEDTTAFASEIYGLFRDHGRIDNDERESRRAMTASQWRGFLNSPLGDELATRIQFQPNFHGMMESDVIFINSEMGGDGPAVDMCMQRIEKLLARFRTQHERQTHLFHCNPRLSDASKPAEVLAVLKPMCRPKPRRS